MYIYYIYFNISCLYVFVSFCFSRATRKHFLLVGYLINMFKLIIMHASNVCSPRASHRAKRDWVTIHIITVKHMAHAVLIHCYKFIILYVLCVCALLYGYE